MDNAIHRAFLSRFSHSFIHLSTKQLDMKSFFTVFFNAKALALSLFFCAPMVATAQVLFTQNFSTNTTENLVPYQGSAANQFDHLAFTGTSTIRVFVSPYQNQLRLFRGGATATNVAFARTTDLVATPDFLRIKFKLQVAASTYAVSTVAVFSVGAGYSADAVAPSDANIHSRFGIGCFNTAQTSGTYTSGTFLLRNLTSFNNTPEFSPGSMQDITWYINNSGSTQSYTNPAGGISTVGDDKADVWVGTALDANFNEMNAVTGGQALTDFKFLLSTNSTVVFDDIEVSGATGVVLPVSLTNFKANKTSTTNQLTWATETETNNKGYNVERQSVNGDWTSLGFVSGVGKASTYTFEDKTPLSISYYRLRQVDFDGTETLSKIVSVSQNSKGLIRITPNPTSDKVTIDLNQNDVSNQAATLVLYDMTGRQVWAQVTTSSAVQLDMSHLAKGMYVLTVQSNNGIYQEKIVRQ